MLAPSRRGARPGLFSPLAGSLRSGSSVLGAGCSFPAAPSLGAGPGSWCCNEWAAGGGWPRRQAAARPTLGLGGRGDPVKEKRKEGGSAPGVDAGELRPSREARPLGCGHRGSGTRPGAACPPRVRCSPGSAAPQRAPSPGPRSAGDSARLPKRGALELQRPCRLAADWSARQEEEALSLPARRGWRPHPVDSPPCSGRAAWPRRRRGGASRLRAAAWPRGTGRPSGGGGAAAKARRAMAAA